MQKPLCGLCNNSFTDRGFTRHLQSCIPRHLGQCASNPNEKTVHLHVYDAFNPEYFLHLAVIGTTTLEDLDFFLRKIWLECCGHLSEFTYGRRGDALSMSQKVFRILDSGNELYYKYDFGDTTELIVRSRGLYPGVLQETQAIHLLARNVQPSILCDRCGKAPAEVICTECQWDGEGWLCSNCIKDHKCDEDMFLNVVNSPRTGVCGYNG